jgi:F-type H+-transporting ATPase subunit epsilon
MAVFHFELVSPERLLFSGEVEQVIVPGSEGEFTVLRDHAPVMTTLRPGIVTIESASGEQKLFVRGGFADVASTGLTILAELAVPVAEFDGARLAREIETAQADAASALDDESRRQATERVGQLEQLRTSAGH